MTWSSPHAKLKSPSNNSNNKQTIIWSKRNATRCHMIGSHWFCGLFCSFSGSLLHPHQMLKYRVRLCSKTSTPQYLFLFKFWSWFLNKTPIRMATPARERERERERDTPPATTERCDIYDIFPLGRCDHSRFPLCYSFN